MERDGEGGEVGRRDRMCDVEGEAGLGKTCCEFVSDGVDGARWGTTDDVRI